MTGEDQVVYAYLNENDCEEISPVSSVEELKAHKEVGETKSKTAEKPLVKVTSTSQTPLVKRKTSKAHDAAASAAIKRHGQPNGENITSTFTES